MKEKCLVDTTFLLKLIIEGEEKLIENVSKYMVYVPVNVLEETAYKIIILSFPEEEKFYTIKKKFENGENIKIIVKRLHALNIIKNKFAVLDLNEEIFELSKELSLKYKLLPNDALIAATCKYYGINKIATFDRDFERVDFFWK